MAGTGGAREGAGRPKGVPNKRSTILLEWLEKAGFHPVIAMARVAMGDVKCPMCDGAKVMVASMDDEGNPVETTCNVCYGSGQEYVPTKMRLDAMAQVAPYVAPKLAAVKIEVSEKTETQAEWLRRIAEEDGIVDVEAITDGRN